MKSAMRTVFLIQPDFEKLAEVRFICVRLIIKHEIKVIKMYLVKYL